MIRAQADFRSASLYEAVDSGAKYKYVMRAEFQNLGDVDLNSLAESLAEINEGPQDTVAIAYRSLIQVEKGACAQRIDRPCS